MPNEREIGTVDKVNVARLAKSIREALKIMAPKLGIEPHEAYIAIGLLKEDLRTEGASQGGGVEACDEIIEEMISELHDHRMSGNCDCEECVSYRKMFYKTQDNQNADRVESNKVENKEQCANCDESHTELCHQTGRCIFCGYAFSADKSRKAIVKAMRVN